MSKIDSPINEIIRKKEDLYKNLCTENTDLTESKITELISQHPSLLERPIYCDEEIAIIGRPPENFKKLKKQMHCIYTFFTHGRPFCKKEVNSFWNYQPSRKRKFLNLFYYALLLFSFETYCNEILKLSFEELEMASSFSESGPFLKGAASDFLFLYENPNQTYLYNPPEEISFTLNFQKDRIIFDAGNHFQFEVKRDSSPLFNKIKKLNSYKFYYEKSKEILKISNESSFVTFDNDLPVQLEGFEGHCHFTGNESHFLECLKNFKIHNKLFKTQIGDKILTFKTISFSGNSSHTNIQIENLDIPHKLFHLNIFSTQFICKNLLYKKTPFSHETFLEGCLEESDIRIGKLSLKNEEEDFHLELDPIERFEFAPESLNFFTQMLQVHSKDSRMGIDEIEGKCLRSEFKEGKPSFEEIGLWCLKQSQLKLKRIWAHEKNAFSNFFDSLISFQKDTVSLFSKHFLYFKDDFKVEINDFHYKCQRIIKNEDYFNFSNLTKECFDSSLLLLGNTKITDLEYKLNMDIKSIELNKNTMTIEIPKAVYHVNDGDVSIDSSKFSCRLDAKIKDIMGLNSDVIIENCLKTSYIKINALKNIHDPSFSLVAFTGIENISYKAKNNGFTLKLRPRIRYFNVLKSKLVNASIQGNVQYFPKKNLITIRIDDIKIFYLIPAKHLVMFLIRSFVDLKNVTIRDNIISISL